MTTFHLEDAKLSFIVQDVAAPTQTLKSTSGGHEQRWGSYQDFLGRLTPRIKQCHPAVQGRGAWEDSIETFIAEWNEDGSMPRLSLLSALCMENETLLDIIAGVADAEFEWLADQFYNAFSPYVGTVHPITGKTLTWSDLCALDLVHEANIKGTACTCRADSGKVGATPENLANAARRMIDVMRARQPSLTPLLIWCPAQSGSYDDMMDSYPGDDYVDVIALDVYAGGLGGTNPPGGSYDNPTHHAASWDRVANTISFSLNGWMLPFAAGDPTHVDVQRCNSALHPGEADQHGGRVGQKQIGFIEWGVISTDKVPSGGDGIIDGGSGDNDIFVNGMIDFFEAHLDILDFQIQFDINVKANRTSHRLSTETDPTKWAYPYPNANIAFNRLRGADN